MTQRADFTETTRTTLIGVAIALVAFAGAFFVDDVRVGLSLSLIALFALVFVLANIVWHQVRTMRMIQRGEPAAIDAIDRQIQSATNDATRNAAKMNKAIVLSQTGRADEAVTILNEIDVDARGGKRLRHSVLINKAVALTNAGRTEEAVAVYDDIHQDSLRGWEKIGFVTGYLGLLSTIDRERARAFFRTHRDVLERRPWWSGARTAIEFASAVYRLQVEDDLAAEAYFRAALDRSRPATVTAAACYNLSLIEHRKGNSKQAAELLAKAQACAPNMRFEPWPAEE